MTNQLPISLEDMPVSLIEIGETIGFGVVIKLVEHYGGLEITIPRCPGADHPVVAALGPRDAEALGALLGGGKIYVPHLHKHSSLEDVRACMAKNMEPKQIARHLKLSIRHVRRLMNETPARDTRQRDMFGDF